MAPTTECATADVAAEESAASYGPSGGGLRKLDIFVLLNCFLAAAMCWVVYYDRFVHYRGPANIHEFLLYTLFLFVAIALLWRFFRRYEFSTSLLVLVQVGILMHFAGAFVPINGGRLYDVQLAGIRYDKVVHFANASIATLVTRRVFRLRGVPMDFVGGASTVLAVLGMGALVEVVEYGACKTVDEAGVGGYDNNMQDLIANVCGSLCCMLVCRGAAGSETHAPSANGGPPDRTHARA